ncbi:MAG: hypothetical protein U1E73_13255 [Planctomycetota bacterium]
MVDFPARSDRFERARKAAEQAVDEIPTRILANNDRELFVRRTFVQVARRIRDEEVAPVPVPPAQAARFEREKAAVRKALGGYALQVERGTGWDPARWKIDLRGTLRQTHEYVLTLAAHLVQSHLDGISAARRDRDGDAGHAPAEAHASPASEMHAGDI